MSSAILAKINETECKLNLTPMIDVTFLLMIFFLLTLRFKTLEGKLSAYLPKDVGVNVEQAEPIEKVEIRLTVVSPGTKVDPNDASKPYGGEGRFEYVDRKIRYHIGPRTTEDIAVVEERLASLFQAAKAAGQKRPATIDARPGTTYGDIIPVLDAAVAVGFDEITFVGEYKKP